MSECLRSPRFFAALWRGLDGNGKLAADTRDALERGFAALL